CCNSSSISSSLNLRGVFDDLPVCDLVTGPFCSITGLSIEQDIKDLNKNDVHYKQHKRKLEKEIEELIGEESDGDSTCIQIDPTQPHSKMISIDNNVSNSDSSESDNNDVT
ncbi:unnamed protein product, partial [Adineta steineri]